MANERKIKTHYDKSSEVKSPDTEIAVDQTEREKIEHLGKVSALHDRASDLFEGTLKDIGDARKSLTENQNIVDLDYRKKMDEIDLKKMASSENRLQEALAIQKRTNELYIDAIIALKTPEETSPPMSKARLQDIFTLKPISPQRPLGKFFSECCTRQNGTNTPRLPLKPLWPLIVKAVKNASESESDDYAKTEIDGTYRAISGDNGYQNFRSIIMGDDM